MDPIAFGVEANANHSDLFRELCRKSPVLRNIRPIALIEPQRLMLVNEYAEEVVFPLCEPNLLEEFAVGASPIFLPVGKLSILEDITQSNVDHHPVKWCLFLIKRYAFLEVDELGQV